MEKPMNLSYHEEKKLVEFIERCGEKVLSEEMEGILDVLKNSIKNHEELYHVKKGVCQNCIDEYDHPVETTLYWVEDSHRAEWLCGDCAREWELEDKQNEEIYGDNN